MVGVICPPDWNMVNLSAREAMALLPPSPDSNGHVDRYTLEIGRAKPSVPLLGGLRWPLWALLCKMHSEGIEGRHSLTI